MSSNRQGAQAQSYPYGYNMQGMGGYPGQQFGQQAAYPAYPGYPYPAGQAGQQVPAMPSAPTPSQPVAGMLPLEQSYIENILRLNRGKIATVYMTFEGNNQKVFTGRIEAAGRDHIILSDPQTEMRYLLLMVYLDYVTFDEEVAYFTQNLTTYSPR